MNRKQKRLMYLGFVTIFFAGFALIALTMLNDQVLFFMTPTDVKERNPTAFIRLGGIVAHESLRQKGLKIIFYVTDGQNSVPVQYTGIIPDLFREGQGVVAEGTLMGGVFQATRLLAKHDETYMPREVVEALKTESRWRPQKLLKETS